jgi:hypothetical protein
LVWPAGFGRGPFFCAGRLGFCRSSGEDGLASLFALGAHGVEALVVIVDAGIHLGLDGIFGTEGEPALAGILPFFECEEAGVFVVFFNL